MATHRRTVRGETPSHAAASEVLIRAWSTLAVMTAITAIVKRGQPSRRGSEPAWNLQAVPPEPRNEGAEAAPGTGRTGPKAGAVGGWNPAP